MSAYRIDLYDKVVHGTARKTFLSNVPALDSYFRVQLSQDIKSRETTCFVATDPLGMVIGFYTLASSGISLADLPAEVTRTMPRYPLVPVIRMGRLAIDHRVQGKGLGGILLADAMVRAARSGIGAFALVVDAKDEAARAFYTHHGFIQFQDDPLALFFPLDKVTS